MSLIKLLAVFPALGVTCWTAVIARFVLGIPDGGPAGRFSDSVLDEIFPLA